MAVRMLKAQTGRLNYKLQRNISAHNLSVYYLKKNNTFPENIFSESFRQNINSSRGGK